MPLKPKGASVSRRTPAPKDKPAPHDDGETTLLADAEVELGPDPEPEPVPAVIVSPVAVTTPVAPRAPASVAKCCGTCIGWVPKRDDKSIGECLPSALVLSAPMVTLDWGRCSKWKQRP